MKKLFFLPFLVLLVTVARGQKKELYLRKTEAKEFYVEHTVVPRENFYAIGRLYNVSARSIAQFNKIDMDKGLDVGQKLKIPLTDSNFTMKGNRGTPVYYKAGLNTTLSRISEAYRNVRVEDLAYWNRRTGEEVAEGEELIIGFLLSKEWPTVTLDHPPVNDPIVEARAEPTPAGLAQESDPSPTKSSSEEVKQEAKPVSTENHKVEVKQEMKEEESEANHDPGYFRKAFDLQVKQRPAKKNKTVTSGIFKTTSGWEDGKYYLLVDEIPPGTIVKLINPSNNAFVYAKVLGEMSGIRMNADLDIRISNAAASVLSISETDKFIMKINY